MENKKILIVEDDESIRKMWVEIINSVNEEGIEILETDNLEEARAILQKTNLYAISLDGEFYETIDKKTKGVFCNILAEEAKKYNIEKIIGVSASPENFNSTLFHIIFDKSKIVLQEYINAILNTEK
ncbi:MAG: response regulator [Candidatus Pacearchaeota archaeon]|nr:response regulator [Candidatus Pacearchaeota archaeon]